MQLAKKLWWNLLELFDNDNFLFDCDALPDSHKLNGANDNFI